MFLGHHAVAFAARRADPRLSLGILVLAATLVDLLWPIFLLLGLERVEIDPGNTAFTPLNFTHYPLTHSIPWSLGWAAALALLWYSRNKAARAAAIVGAVVFSHWVLDVISHGPDVPVMPGGPYVGLGLWHSMPATLLVESALFAGGVLLYARGTRARDRAGRWSLWSLVVFLAIIYAANAFGPPPPGERAIAYGALAAWLFVPWAYWIDRHRDAAVPASSR